MEMKNKTVIGKKIFAYVKVKDLKISEYNVRPGATPEEKEEIKTELAKSIKELGLQQLPVITPEGEVFIGGRRTIAFKELGEEWMLAEIRNAAPFEQMIASYTENFHRKSPDYMNEGRLFKEMIKEGVAKGDIKLQGHGDKGHGILGKKLGISNDYVDARVRIFETLSSAAGGSGIAFEQARMLSTSDIPDDKRAELVKMASEGIKTQDLKKIIATTNATKALLEGETEEVQKQAEKEFKDQLYTKDLDITAIKWRLEEIAGDSHSTGKGRIWWDEHGITSTEEAIAWFKKYGGRHLRDLKGSDGEWDKTKEKMTNGGKNEDD